jgi:hypothetical protein
MVAYTCHPSYTGSTNKRTAVQANLGKNVKPYLKKKKKEEAKRAWGHGLRGSEAPGSNATIKKKKQK